MAWLTISNVDAEKTLKFNTWNVRYLPFTLKEITPAANDTVAQNDPSASPRHRR